MTIQDYIKQYVKGPALRLGAEEAAGQIAGGGGPVVPDDAKLYFPDVEGIVENVFYLLNDSPGATDSVFLDFKESRIGEISVLSGGTITAKDILTDGFYASQTDNNIAYSGIFNFGAFEGGDEYSAGIWNYNDLSSGDDEEYNFSLQTDVTIQYNWEFDSMGNQYYIDIRFSDLAGVAIVTGTITVDGVTNEGTYSVAAFGSGN